VRALEEHVGRRGRDLGDRGAHHAADRDGLLEVGDQQVLGAQRSLDVVEGHQPLALLRHPDHDPRSGHQGEVERVHRLAQLEHGVVRGVDHVRHRAHPGRREASLGPQRRGPDLNASQDTGQVPRAPIEVPDLDGGHVRGLLVALGQRGVGGHDRHAGGHRSFPGHPEHAEQVRPVRLDLDVEDDVVQAVGRGEVGPDRGVGGQDQDAAVVAGQADLPGGAQHPVRVEAAHRPNAEGLLEDGHPRARPSPRDEVPLAHVPDPGQDLGLRRAVGDPGDAELLRSRVIAHLQDAGHDDADQALPGPQDRLDLHALRGETLGQLLDGEVGRAQLEEPRPGDPHASAPTPSNCSRNRTSPS
jgi:hypothetical protein